MSGAEDLADITEESTIFDELDVVHDRKTEEEIVQAVHRNIQKRFDEQFERRNLIYLRGYWLHKGPRVLKFAQAVAIRQSPQEVSQKKIFVYIEVWRRQSQSTPYFSRDRRFLLDAPMTQVLLSYLLQAEVIPTSQEERGPLPAAEVFDNLNTSQRQSFANILSDLTLSHQLTDLYQSGQLSLATLNHLAAAAQQIKYKTELQELRHVVDGVTTKVMRGGKPRDVDEHAYQEWFEMHPWVFGTEYIKRLDLRDIDTQATIDIALQTFDGFIDILELKIPEAKVLLFDRSHKIWHFTIDVIKVLAQAAKYLDTIERRAEEIHFRPRLRDHPVLSVRLRVRMVIGRCSNWTQEQHEAFRRLGAMLHGIELMTFDHVLACTEQLISRYGKTLELETIKLDAFKVFHWGRVRKQFLLIELYGISQKPSQFEHENVQAKWG